MVMDIILMVVDIHWPMHFTPVKVSDLVRFISTLKKIGPFTVIKALLETIICWRIFISDTFCLKDAFK